jgi:hypothetical protein
VGADGAGSQRLVDLQIVIGGLDPAIPLRTFSAGAPGDAA